MSFFRRIRAALIFSRHQAWVDEPLWEADDAAALHAFLQTVTGKRLRARYLNTVLRQQAQALSADLDKLPFEAGYCAGQKGLLALTEAWADITQFTEPGEQDDDPATIQPTS